MERPLLQGLPLAAAGGLDLPDRPGKQPGMPAGPARTGAGRAGTADLLAPGPDLAGGCSVLLLRKATGQLANWRPARPVLGRPGRSGQCQGAVCLSPSCARRWGTAGTDRLHSRTYLFSLLDVGSLGWPGSNGAARNLARRLRWADLISSGISDRLHLRRAELLLPSIG